MAITPRNIIPRKQAENSTTTQYTAVSCKAVIDKFTITNTTASIAVFTAYLVASGGAAGAANCVVSGKSIAPGETYSCPEMVGQILEPGDFIATLAGTPSALTISASGREIT